MLTQILYPEATRRARERIRANPVRCFTLGLADAVAALVIFILLATLGSRFPPLLPVLLIFVLIVLALTVLGLAGVYGTVGGRMSLGSLDRTPAGEILRGGALLETATLIPLLGWLATALVLCMALGAGVLQLFQPKKVAAPDLPPPREAKTDMEA